jgi:hypothetical protein
LKKPATFVPFSLIGLELMLNSMITVDVSPHKPTKEQLREWNQKLHELGLGIHSGRIQLQRADEVDPFALEKAMQEGLRVHGPRVGIRGSRGRYKPAVINKEVIRVPWAPCNPDYVTKREMRAVFLIHLRKWGVPMPVCAEILRKPLRTVERMWRVMKQGRLPRAYGR